MNVYCVFINIINRYLNYIFLSLIYQFVKFIYNNKICKNSRLKSKYLPFTPQELFFGVRVTIMSMAHNNIFLLISKAFVVKLIIILPFSFLFLLSTQTLDS